MEKWDGIKMWKNTQLVMVSSQLARQSRKELYKDLMLAIYC
jgi:hypothetical protein